MTNFLGTVELPLTILLWFGVGAVMFMVVLFALAALYGGISTWADHKKQLRWDEMMKGVRK
jgi:hypothetical protein